MILLLLLPLLNGSAAATAAPPAQTPRILRADGRTQTAAGAAAAAVQPHLRIATEKEGRKGAAAFGRRAMSKRHSFQLSTVTKTTTTTTVNCG